MGEMMYWYIQHIQAGSDGFVCVQQEGQQRQPQVPTAHSADKNQCVSRRLTDTYEVTWLQFPRREGQKSSV